LTTGQVAYLDGPESVQLKEYELPTPDDGDVIAEIIRAKSVDPSSTSGAANVLTSMTASSTMRRYVAWSRLAVRSAIAPGMCFLRAI
jgi:hypothetical protein